MTRENTLTQYAAYRGRFYEKLDDLRVRMDRFFERVGNGEPTLSDLALLEGMHQEKEQLFSDFMKVHEELIGNFLTERRGK
jgi:hypothetical protein